jgi:predicted hotdog family 3-hydroxylacyl-ACP dehydratase
MKTAGITVEDLLPHRGRMKLIDEIVEVNENKAVTRSKVTDQWPFFNGTAVGSLVLIELAAQTAGICNCWDGIRTQGDKFVKKGWLVGVRDSRFLVDAVPLDACIITTTENRFKFETFREISARAAIGSEIVAEMTLQLVQADTE